MLGISGPLKWEKRGRLGWRGPPRPPDSGAGCCCVRPALLRPLCCAPSAASLHDSSGHCHSLLVMQHHSLTEGMLTPSQDQGIQARAVSTLPPQACASSSNPPRERVGLPPTLSPSPLLPEPSRVRAGEKELAERQCPAAGGRSLWFSVALQALGRGKCPGWAALAGSRDQLWGGIVLC